MDYLIRLVQIHETFRKPEIQALAVLANINVEILVYSEYVCGPLWGHGPQSYENRLSIVYFY